uniref:NADH dehydrogenase [ubiquinone] 1 beta subcomplex subunit 9 n=1 Tax=Globisporangium ultimum (strain ATCC 200006 / CBS 805.95 / DAOM BR144) TaxID=431595 RepID=K3WSQ1_GLOUD
MKVNPNMNKTFREVVARFGAPAEELSHKQAVQRLYKQSLKTLDSWIIDRRLWNEEATKIRAQFDQNRNLDPSSGLAKRLVREAQEKVEHYTHPDKYVFNYMPGGTRFMRNAPIPLDVCFPDGVIPDDVEVSPMEAINIDMTPLPAKPTVFIDFSKKGYD